MGKSHFMVREDIILRHIASEKGKEVDKIKIDSIINLPPPNSFCQIDHSYDVVFYERFIKDF